MKKYGLRFAHTFNLFLTSSLYSIYCIEPRLFFVLNHRLGLYLIHISDNASPSQTTSFSYSLFCCYLVLYFCCFYSRYVNVLNAWFYNNNANRIQYGRGDPRRWKKTIHYHYYLRYYRQTKKMLQLYTIKILSMKLGTKSNCKLRKMSEKIFHLVASSRWAGT